MVDKSSQALQSARCSKNIEPQKDIYPLPTFLCNTSALWILLRWEERSSRASPPVAASSPTLKTWVCTVSSLLASSAVCFPWMFSVWSNVKATATAARFFLWKFYSAEINCPSGYWQTQVKLSRFLYMSKTSEFIRRLWWTYSVLCSYGGRLTACLENGLPVALLRPCLLQDFGSGIISEWTG